MLPSAAADVRMAHQASPPCTYKKQPCAVTNRLHWDGRNLTRHLEFDRQLVCFVNFRGFYFEGGFLISKSFPWDFPQMDAWKN